MTTDDVGNESDCWNTSWKSLIVRVISIFRPSADALNQVKTVQSTLNFRPMLSKNLFWMLRKSSSEELRPSWPPRHLDSTSITQELFLLCAVWPCCGSIHGNHSHVMSHISFSTIQVCTQTSTFTSSSSSNFDEFARHLFLSCEKHPRSTRISKLDQRLPYIRHSKHIQSTPRTHSTPVFSSSSTKTVWETRIASKALRDSRLSRLSTSPSQASRTMHALKVKS